MRYFSCGPASARVDSGGVLFDVSGAPLDLEWHCPLEELAAKVDILRQTWPEDILREIFAEAAKLSPGLPAEPPAPVPCPPIHKAPHRRAKRSETPPNAENSEPLLRGFGQSALQALSNRVSAAANAIDGDFPRGPHQLILERVDLNERFEERFFAAGTERGIRILLRSEMRDGIGGPVAYPVSATFDAFGLRAGCSLHGIWTGTEVEATIECQEVLREGAMRLLR